MGEPGLCVLGDCGALGAAGCRGSTPAAPGACTELGGVCQGCARSQTPALRTEPGNGEPWRCTWSSAAEVSGVSGAGARTELGTGEPRAMGSPGSAHGARGPFAGPGGDGGEHGVP